MQLQGPGLLSNCHSWGLCHQHNWSDLLWSFSMRNNKLICCRFNAVSFENNWSCTNSCYQLVIVNMALQDFLNNFRLGKSLSVRYASWEHYSVETTLHGSCLAIWYNVDVPAAVYQAFVVIRRSRNWSQHHLYFCSSQYINYVDRFNMLIKM